MKHKAIALISGGLDSLLAARVIMDQGIEVIGVTFVMAFASKDIEKFKKHVTEASAEAGIPHKIVDISQEFMSLITKPKHGFGANINPCIDCKIMMLKNAKNMMKTEGASFVITGEVLGERPMSQNRRSLATIKEESGLEGYLVRPLSAKLLEVSIPEEEGILKREQLLDIQGRSREPQLRLAEEYGITKFSTPAGGCLLTDPIFAKRLTDIKKTGTMDLDEVALLKWGRHFRLDENTKVVVGRDELENEGLMALKKEDDIILRLKDKNGPYALLRGNAAPDNIAKASSLVMSHSKSKHDETATVEYWKDLTCTKETEATPLARSKVDAIRI